MAFKIGFHLDHTDKAEQTPEVPAKKTEVLPKKSVVQVQFPGKAGKLAYYNDKFDLHPGDRVYVDGKMEGVLGQVVEVSCHFKIKTADYRKVIALVDTEIRGELHMAGSHFVGFDPEVLSYGKILSWFKAPVAEGEEVVTGSDGESFPLADLSQMKISAAVAERGHDYYLENRVRYLAVNGNAGKAIVEGSEIYEVEFCYHNGQISDLLCDCPCTCHCKHEFAVMLQLREILEWIEKNNQSTWEETNCFAAVYKPTLFLYAIDGKQKGKITL